MAALLVFFLLTFVHAVNGACKGEQDYNLVINMTWSKATDRNFDPKVSKVGLVVVAVHNSKFKLFEVGQKLSDPLRGVVKNGAFQPILELVQKDKNVKHIDYKRSIPVQGEGTFTVRTEVEPNGNMTYVSLIGGLNGTPDLFFGVSRINLCAGSNFRKSKAGDLEAFDAGYDARTDVNGAAKPENLPVRKDNRTTLVGIYGTYTLTEKMPVCFPSDATVVLEGGATRRMDQLKVGDRVAVGGGVYSEVFMFTHKMDAVTHEFVSITTASGATIRLTAGHYLPLNGAYAAAGEARVGDRVSLSDGTTSAVVAVSQVWGRGLYNPQTTHGDIVVDGVRASTYTTAVQRTVAHALLAPLRLACAKLGVRFTLLDSEATILRRMVASE